MPNALIVYASLTGNTEDIAEILHQSLNEIGVKATMEECEQVEAEEFLKYDICVVATYTYGSDGDLPDEIEWFYEDLADLDLSGKVYGVLGSGEEIYDKFCQSVDDFDEQFAKTGAIKGAESVKVEGMALSKDETDIKEFAKSLLVTFQSKEVVAY